MEPKAYIYSRFSSAKQAQGDTLRRQFQECVEFAGTLGVPVDTTLRDEGLSGYTGLNRIKGALGSFLARVERGEIARGSFLLVDSMDRISREQETIVLNLLTGLSLAGVRICNVSERHVLPASPDTTDWIRLLIHAARSHRESEEKARKVAAAHGESKRRARAEGRIWHATGPTWLRAVVIGDGKARKICFKPIPEKVAVVARIFDMRETGLGTTAIASKLTAEGVLPPKGGKGGWHHSAVLEVLKNRGVIGEYQPKNCPKGYRGSRRPADGDPVPGYYPAIVSEAQFHRVQALIAARAPKTRAPNKRGVTNLFGGIARCGICGANMGIHVSAGRRSAVLRCYDAPRGVCTNKTRYPYEAVERAILCGVPSFDLTPRPQVMGKPQAALETALARVAELDLMRANLLDKMERIGTDEALEGRYRDRTVELDELRKRLPALRHAVEAGAVNRAPVERAREIESLFTTMAQQEGDKLFLTRSRLAQAIKDVVTRVEFRPAETRVEILGAKDAPTQTSLPARFSVSVLDGLAAYGFDFGEDRTFRPGLSLQPAADVLDMPRYRRRFTGDDPGRELKARRVLRRVAAG